MGRRYGQHFLHQASVVDKILEAAQVSEHEQVLEIGPGEGVLTAPLCRLAGRVLACEVDPELAQRLPGHQRLEVVVGDFLEQPLEKLLGDGPWKVVANLPYYITTPILEKLLLEGAGRISGMWLMMQKEVAQRIVSPASRLAGSLTYFVGLRARPRLLFTVKPGAFRPPPAVDSAVLELIPTPIPEAIDSQRFTALVRQAFQMRRKTLKRSLRGLVEEPERLLQKADIDPKRRPETLTLEDFIRLERLWGEELGA